MLLYNNNESLFLCLEILIQRAITIRITISKVVNHKN